MTSVQRQAPVFLRSTWPVREQGRLVRVVLTFEHARLGFEPTLLALEPIVL